MRLIGDNVEQGIYTYQQAMHIADEQNLDLVEIAPTAVPPVCRIIDYQKFLYAQKKKQKEAKANAKKMEVKEIRFGPQTTTMTTISSSSTRLSSLRTETK